LKNGYDVLKVPNVEHGQKKLYVREMAWARRSLKPTSAAKLAFVDWSLEKIVILSCKCEEDDTNKPIV
jgi:hypothetical protein